MPMFDWLFAWRSNSNKKAESSALPIVVVEGAGVVINRNQKFEAIGGPSNASNDGKSAYFFMCNDGKK